MCELQVSVGYRIPFRVAERRHSPHSSSPPRSRSPFFYSFLSPLRLRRSSSPSPPSAAILLCLPVSLHSLHSLSSISRTLSFFPSLLRQSIFLNSFRCLLCLSSFFFDLLFQNHFQRCVITSSICNPNRYSPWLYRLLFQQPCGNATNAAALFIPFIPPFSSSCTTLQQPQRSVRASPC